MKYLPIGLDIRDRECLVVGGGAIGMRKVQNLLRAGGRVTLVSLQVTAELAKLASSGEIRWVNEAYREGLLHGVFLAVVATDDEGVNARVVVDAKKSGILICDSTSRERSQLIFGALHQDEGVIVAVFTDGEDPSRAKETRDRIAAFVSPAKDREAPEPE